MRSSVLEISKQCLADSTAGDLKFTVSGAIFFSQIQRPYHRHLLQQASHLMHLATEMLLPFVRWLYGTPSPRHPAPYGLPPNMSESSGPPGVTHARGSFASVFPQVSLARP